jgi:beta-lactamase regulating signal transducer with metallopeptidase domain/ABC-type amino acid transport substrate-binding protein
MNLLLDTALKGSLLIGAAAAASYFLRGRSAAARHAAWTAAVIGHLALPALSVLMPEWKLPLIPSPSWIQTEAPAATISHNEIQSTPAPKTDSKVETALPVATSQTPGVDKTSGFDALLARARATNIPPVIALWILGSLIVLLRLAVGTWKVGRLAKEGDRVDDGEWLSLTQRLAKRLEITRPLTLLRGDKLAVPVTWGVVYPAVLLPPDADEWPEERRRFVLVHEMAHVKRFDALTQLLAQFAIALFWFDPLIWLAAHRMRVEREHACDDYVLRDGTKPSLYAGELLEMVQSIGTPHRETAAPAFAALAMARRSEFEGRMLAILDSRQDRHTLGRSSAIAASVLLGLLIFPLAALRPFAARTAAAEPIVTAPRTAAAPVTKEKNRLILHISANACDSAIADPGESTSNHVHVDDGEDGAIPVLEYLTSSRGRCAQGAFVGKPVFADDRLISLGDNSYITIKEVTPSSNKGVRVTRRANGTMQFAAQNNGASVPFDDSMRAWLSRLLPEILTESAVDAPQRVARDLARGGVPAVLRRIAGIKSPSSRRAHYEALLDGRPLTLAEYDQVAKHLTRNLASSPTDLSAVLSRIAAGPAKGTKSLGAAVAALGRSQDALSNALDAALGKNKSSGDTAQTLTQYGVTDDPEMLFLALQGASDISSDGDKRVLLQTLAAGALRRNESKFRTAWFDAAATISSSTDLRVALQTALPYGHHDPLVTTNVLKLVGDQISSDGDKRVVLMTAIAQKLIKSSRERTEFMTAARTISSDSEMAIVMAAASKQ